MNAPVRKAQLPNHSALLNRVGERDFLDCYAVASDLSPRHAAEAAFDQPGWVRGLMKLRNVIVAPFGLATEAAPGVDTVGLFPTESETEREIIAGLDDKHLDFRVSVMSHEGEIFLATWVRTHNLGGRLYLSLVMPFHVLIVRNALKRVRSAG